MANRGFTISEIVGLEQAQLATPAFTEGGYSWTQWMTGGPRKLPVSSFK